MKASLKSYLFLFTVLGFLFLPLTAFAKSSPVRAYFDVFVIEAAKPIGLRLTVGLKDLVANVSALASTKPVARFTSDLKKLEAQLDLKFPNYRSFKLIFKQDVHFIGQDFDELVIAKNPELKLRLYYLGKSTETGLHDVRLELNDQFLCDTGIAPESTMFRAEIPYHKDTLILAITLLFVRNPDAPYPSPIEKLSPSRDDILD